MPLLDVLEGSLTRGQLAELNQHAPVRIEVPSGSRIRVQYQPDGPPVLAVRIQEVFGLAETPRIAGGRADGIEVDYRLRKKGDAWKLTDVRIEGVGLVRTYGEEYEDVLGRGGPEALLKQLREKNPKKSAENADG